jgi:hypothetical protein
VGIAAAGVSAPVVTGPVAAEAGLAERDVVRVVEMASAINNLVSLLEDVLSLLYSSGKLVSIT